MRLILTYLNLLKCPSLFYPDLQVGFYILSKKRKSISRRNKFTKVFQKFGKLETNKKFTFIANFVKKK